MKGKRIEERDLVLQNAQDTEGVFQMDKDVILSSGKILDLLKCKIKVEKEKKRQRQVTILAITACLMIIVGANWEKVYSYASELFTKFTVKTADGTIIAEEKIELINTIEPTEVDEKSYYLKRKEYSSLEECAEELAITLLKSDLVWDFNYEGRVTLSYPNLDILNMVTIIDQTYIVGDMSDIELQGSTGIVYKRGELYQRPVWLRVEFVTNAKNNIVSSEEHSRTYPSYTETYIGSNGIKAYILDTAYNVKAFFFHNNIKYSLDGGLPLEEMKRIIDSFY